MPYPVRVIPGNGVAIETLELRKAYRSVRGRAVGVDGIDLRVPAGGVHALLGLTGSGKTTTLRLLTGLAHADGGAMRIFGTHVPDGLPDLAGRIGAVVGDPGFQPRLSGRRNLALLASAAGVPRARVDELLTRVVLADRARAAYGTYSPDEGRRLALAAALLRDPDLLVVDDPSAGLGAVGTREIRQALRRLADRGTTVLIATGVLTEAQQIADTVTVLDAGRVLAQGSVAELLGDARVSVRVGVDEPAKAASALRAAGFKVRADGETLHVDDVAEPAEISRALAKQKLFAGELVPQREDLAAVVGRLRPVVVPTPVPPSRAEERAARKAAERKVAERKKAAEQRKADKEAAARQAAAETKAAEDAVAKQAALDERAAAKQAALDARAAAKEAAQAERDAAREARRSASPRVVAEVAAAARGGVGVRGAKGRAAKPGVVKPGAAVKSAAAKPGARGSRTAAPAGDSARAAPKPDPASATDAKGAGAETGEADAPKLSRFAQRRAEFDARVAEKQAAEEARLAERQAAAEARASAKEAAAETKRAAAEARRAEKQAAEDAKVAAKQGRVDARQAKADAKQAESEARAARKQEAAEARTTRPPARKDGARSLLGRRAAETSGGQDAASDPEGLEPGAPEAEDREPDDLELERLEAERARLEDLDPDDTDLDEAELGGLDPDGGDAYDDRSDDPDPEDSEPDDPGSDDPEPDDPGPNDPGAGGTRPDSPRPGSRDGAGQGRPHPGQQGARRQGSGQGSGPQGSGRQDSGGPGSGRGKKRSKGRR